MDRRKSLRISKNKTESNDLKKQQDGIVLKDVNANNVINSNVAAGKKIFPGKKEKLGLPFDDLTSGKKRSNLIKSNESIGLNYYEKLKVDKTTNFARFLQNSALGLCKKTHEHKHAESILVDDVKKFDLWKVTSPFVRRGTCLRWHPFNSEIFVAGSKFGDLYLWDVSGATADIHLPQLGPGNVVQDLRFLRESTQSCRIVMASMDGTVSIRDLATSSEERLFGERWVCFDYWPCSLEVADTGHAVLMGDSKGSVSLISTKADKVWDLRLHKARVNHIEFHPTISWLFCTASTDRTVSLWDLRMMKSKQDFITQLQHESGVASASFSRTDGQRLLTTDQQHSLRVYRCGSWSLEKDFCHPHRHFQRLTPIKMKIGQFSELFNSEEKYLRTQTQKETRVSRSWFSSRSHHVALTFTLASWHPLEDIVVCARYPDPALPGYTTEDTRGIDVFSMYNDQRAVHLYNPSVSQIASRTEFNSTGSYLAATMGTSLLVWKRAELEDSSEGKKSVTNDNLLHPISTADRNNQARKQSRKKKEQNLDSDTTCSMKKKKK